jgi:hypothetical protein
MQDQIMTLNEWRMAHADILSWLIVGLLLFLAYMICHFYEKMVPHCVACSVRLPREATLCPACERTRNLDKLFSDAVNALHGEGKPVTADSVLERAEKLADQRPEYSGILK